MPNGNAAVTLSGTIARDLVVVAGVLTIHAGTVVSLSTADGLRADGNVDLGADPAKITVGFSGAISDLHNWTSASAPRTVPRPSSRSTG